MVEGADSLSAYYAAMAKAVNALADKWKKDRGYVPQSYPQLAKALGQISRAVTGTRIDLPVDKGYGLVTDYINVVLGAVFWGTFNGVITYLSTGDARRAYMCGFGTGAIFFAMGAGPALGLSGVRLGLYEIGMGFNMALAMRACDYSAFYNFVDWVFNFFYRR